ncbi:hypothetical protein HNQ80_004111 [Anaerosolibacter carboniphilus]|uniref:Uncharacterized protein n=1 Tax=Anaerosolibacter carboniphilus TaxID=1417629 RepID=A0A841KWG4_9FIRM|nr:hypothetical protein [Anaerosolibacter carboniphilus]
MKWLSMRGYFVTALLIIYSVPPEFIIVTLYEILG